MTSITGDVLQGWDDASRREWLVTNGIGGYASSTLSGANTRRYHGLLVAALSPPLGRTVVFSKLEEEIRVEDQLYQLSANKYPSVVQPQGYRHLTHFTTDPVPTFTYMFHEGSVVLEKSIWMSYGQNTVYIRYRLLAAPERIRIGLLPLLAYKDYHTEQRRWDGFPASSSRQSDNQVELVAFNNAVPLKLSNDGHLAFSDHSGWFYNFEHPREMERGLDFTEDLYCPGRFDGVLPVGQTVTFVATTESEPPVPADAALQAELSRRRDLLETAGVDAAKDTVRATLTLAADQFVIPHSDRTTRATVIAGYPWFTDWGRDTMIALPGLCLTTRRFDIAREILESFAAVTKDGLLPNRFSDNGAGADYNTVDASLWFFHAVHQYAEQSGDWNFAVQKMLPVLSDIAAHHVAGTDYGIRVDSVDGLLRAGEAGHQLTWMDARVGDWVVTPRIGKPVEINALWYNALRVLATLEYRAGNDVSATDYDKRAARVKASFTAAFWNAGAHSLYDVINPDGVPDSSLRPNQIFAVSLPFPMFTGSHAQEIVAAVESSLLTPYGLRTLAAGSPGYSATYGPGDQRRRDGAYHQGTVWPWLIGHFVDAHLKVYGNKARSRALLNNLTGVGLSVYGVGTLAEIFDADAPYAPNGCIAQAWSVSEVLRAWVNTAG